MRRARRKGWAFVIVDGALIACDRLAADRPFYSGKHKRHGMKIQVVAAPDGELLWVSECLLGSVHDVRAAGIFHLADRIAAAGLFGLGDKRYVGLCAVVLYPFKGRGKPEWKKQANSGHAWLRGPGERTISQLKNWAVMKRLRSCPYGAGEIARAVLVLQNRESR
ncbi:hypothetical protein GCM10009799_29730 [Nocardiopsis rhodophaea]|uniref:DDE Tnp4 domain-containing protein n=1 Tax=Nocardiopsis rhodophaea TaxID=280238 RepID=A0ABN2T6Y2_9ACTN